MSNIGSSGRASGGELEEKVDLTPETDAKLAQSAQLAGSGHVREALAMMAALEKRCRTGNDTANLKRVCEASLKYCKDAGDDELLLTTLQTLATRRSQKTQAIRALVETCIPWCIEGRYTPKPVADRHKKKARDDLVEALREISDGKIFLEAERARLTRCMAMIMVRVSVTSLPHDVEDRSCTGCILLTIILVFPTTFVRRNKRVTLPRPPMCCRRCTSRHTDPCPNEKRWNSSWNRCG
jgi:hypothetical protein